MRSDFRLHLLVGAFVIFALITGFSIAKGEDWFVSVGIMMAGFLFLLVFQLISFYKDDKRQSTPISVQKNSITTHVEDTQEELPDPLDSGIDLPML